MELSSTARLNRYRPYFDATTARYQLPPGLLYSVAQQESAGNPFAISSEGATGLMQFMRPTAVQYGLAGQGFDYRTNPILSINAAGNYLRDLYDRFGNWPAALAAYNAGPTRVASGKPLPAETRAYVPAVIGFMDRYTRGDFRAGPETKTGAGAPVMPDRTASDVSAPTAFTEALGWMWPGNWQALIQSFASAAVPIVIIMLIGIGLILTGFQGLV